MHCIVPSEPEKCRRNPGRGPQPDVGTFLEPRKLNENVKPAIFD